MRSKLVALGLALAVLGTACDEGGSQPPRSQEPTPRRTEGTPGERALKIGLVGTMTGASAWRGEDAFEGADLGVHHLNRRVGNGERRYALEVLDDRGDPELSLDLLGDLLRRGDTVGIVYAGPPSVLIEAEDQLRRAGVPAVLCYGDLYGARQLSPRSHVFQAAPPYAWQARDLARYIARDRAYEKVGVLTEATTLDGDVAVEAATQSLQDYGIDRVVDARYHDEVRRALARLRDRQVEAVIVQGEVSAVEQVFDEIRRLGAGYRNTRAARIASLNNNKERRRRQRNGWWHPQILGFDRTMNERMDPPPPGTMATATYARGVHLLPVPSFKLFRRAFKDWWDTVPQGYELRAYEAALAIGWAAERAGTGDIARALEDLRGKRFGGLPVTLGPDDHVFAEEVTIGLWTIPFPGDSVGKEPPESLPWVPLARGFSIDGETTDILSADWKWLFRKAPPPGGPAPRFKRMRFGVTTPRSDPLR